MIWQFGTLVLIDQITKAYFAGRDFFFLGIHFHPINNYALPFGLDFGPGLNFVILFFVYLIVGWMIFRIKLEGDWSQWGKPIFLAGATSNLIDRMMLGYVRDFIDLGLGFVFNLADVFILTGLIIVLL
ncbi:MAG TPA: signal peptidase II [Candidatus Binatia bacterium]|nr:signal peptidase II [Candidatus Binatia bacterium]